MKARTALTALLLALCCTARADDTDRERERLAVYARQGDSQLAEAASTGKPATAKSVPTGLHCWYGAATGGRHWPPVPNAAPATTRPTNWKTWPKPPATKNSSTPPSNFTKHCKKATPNAKSAGWAAR